MIEVNSKQHKVLKQMVQKFARDNIGPEIVKETQVVAPYDKENDKVDLLFFQSVLTDIDTIITVSSMAMMDDFVKMKQEEIIGDEDILNTLAEEYDTYLVNQFISYGVTFSAEGIDNILTEMIVFLPDLYYSVLEENDEMSYFLSDEFFAYLNYLDDNFNISKEEEDE